MSFLTKLKGLPAHLPHGIAPAHGFKGFLRDKGERALYAAVLGAAKGYWYDKLVFRGIGFEAYVGVLGYLGSAFLGGNKSLERMGDAGMTTYLYAWAASWGGEKAGRPQVTAQQLPQSKKAVVGVIPPRQAGAFLTADEMANYAAAR